MALQGKIGDLEIAHPRDVHRHQPVILAAPRRHRPVRRKTGDQMNEPKLQPVQREAVQRIERRRRLADTHNVRGPRRSEEHTSELQSLMRTSYAVFCLKKKTNTP